MNAGLSVASRTLGGYDEGSLYVDGDRFEARTTGASQAW